MPTPSSPADLHSPRRFPWPALAALAGRQPLGGEREVALACLMAARVASGALGPDPLTEGARAERAFAARGWMASLALPPSLRAPLQDVLDASSNGAAAELARSVRALSRAAGDKLDAPSRAELERLAREAERG